MPKPHIGANSSFVGIPSAPSWQVSRDAYETEKLGTQVINIEALRAIGRIVQAIKQRTEAGEGTGAGHDTENPSAGDPHGSTTISPNSSPNSNREGTEYR
jgi:hypothetical protein